jgi:hypothetical protein
MRPGMTCRSALDRGARSLRGSTLDAIGTVERFLAEVRRMTDAKSDIIGRCT